MKVRIELQKVEHCWCNRPLGTASLIHYHKLDSGCPYPILRLDTIFDYFCVRGVTVDVLLLFKSITTI